LLDRFFHQLFEILENEEYSHLISWLPHGKGFVIHRKKEFAAEILPRHFKKAVKFTSFTRKLSRWGFSRASRGPETGAYFHRLFRRDNPKLVDQMASSSSGSSKYQSAPFQQQLFPDAQGMMAAPGGGMPMFPFMMGPNVSPQQQQLMLQQQMQMMQLQQMQLMQMQMQRQGQQGMPDGAGGLEGGNQSNEAGTVPARRPEDEQSELAESMAALDPTLPPVPALDDDSGLKLVDHV
jgi:hypothetical protein